MDGRQIWRLVGERTDGAGNYVKDEVRKEDIETEGDYMQTETGVGE